MSLPAFNKSACWAALTVAAGLALTAVGAWQAQRNEVERRHKVFDDIAGQVEREVQTRLGRHVYGLKGARAAAAANGALLDPGAFRRYVQARDLPREFPGITGLGIIERVERDALPAFVARFRAAYGDAFRLHTSGGAPDLYVIRSAEPLASNAAALGFDVGPEPTRRATVTAVYARRTAQATAPIRLVQDPLQRPGALYMLPVFASGGHAPTGDADRVIGVVYTALTYASVLEGASQGVTALWLEDVGVAPERRLLHAEGTAAKRDPHGLTHVTEFEFGGRPLRLHVAPTAAFASTLPWLLWAGIVSGVLASLLAGVAVFALHRSRARAVAYAARVTRDLEEQRSLLAITLDSIGDAVLTTDARGRITWMNPVAERLTQFDCADAVGRPVDEVLRLEFEDAPGRSPCPVAACLRERRVVAMDAQTVLVARDGDTRCAVEDSAAPIVASDGALIGCVVVFHDVSEARAMAREMSHRAGHDALTGLANRRTFEARVAQALERADGARDGAVLFMDLDHFKIVNDTSGHAAGDSLLEQIADILRAHVRAGDTVARFGGDEFALLLEGCSLEAAERIAVKIRDAVDVYRFNARDGHCFRVGASIGLVALGSGAGGVGAVLQRADAACYEAKDAGRNRVVVHREPVLPNAVPSARVQWGPLVADALQSDRFVLLGQRVQTLDRTRRTVAVEALVRMVAEDGTLVAPGQFVAAAERYQLATRVDRWVLARCLALLSASPHRTRLNVNVSGQSVGDRAFQREALHAIVDSGVDADRLCIEITETTAITSLSDAALFVRELRALGVHVALDDFGSGTSSYTYLKRLPVDALKIDGRFIRDMRGSELDRSIVRSFVDVAAVLHLDVVAEHIEDEATLAELAAMGVGYGQGYLLHRPEPLERLLGVVSPMALAS